jgi:PAS domain S-box-containing protein
MYLISKLWQQDRIQQRPYWLKALYPFLLAVLATWLTISQLSTIGYNSPFLIYFAAIFLSACYGGWWSAMLCTIAGTIGAFSFILPLHKSGTAFEFSILLFFLESLLLTCLFHLIEKAHVQLKQREALFRGMIEQSAEGFLLANSEGVITYAAPIAGELLGYTCAELKGMTLQALVHSEEWKSFEYRFLKLRNDYGNKIKFLQRLKTGDGSWLWIEGSASNLLKDERVRALIFNYRNVTERVAHDKQQEDFIHMASHELKTPITALKGFSQLLRLNHRKEGQDKDEYVLNRMDMQLNKLLGLVDDMLDVTRIKTGDIRYHFDWFDLNQCVLDVIEAQQVTSPGHQLKFIAINSCKLYGDKDKISQVITNLITNAIKYSPGKDSVELGIEKDERCVYLKVKDQGVGIPKGKQQKVFERFYRVDGDSRKKIDGLGLGLYISMEIIKKHKGKMGVESEEGKGSEFWFGLPLSPAGK